MKDVYYDGSLKDDIELINNNDELYHKLSIREKMHAALWVVFLGIYVMAYALTKKFFPWLTFYIVANNHNSSKWREVDDEKDKRKKKRRETEKKVKNFIEDLNPNLNETDGKKCHVTDGYVTYDILKDAVIVTSEEIKQAEEGYESFLYDYDEEDFDEYVKVITSDMYFLDTRNKIRALRETKKIVKHSSKNPKVKETKLELFEDKDFPSPLPVEKKLELKDNYFM